MAKKVVFTENAPAPIGPYSQAVWGGDTLYISGQIAINPETGEYVEETIEKEVRQIMSNLNAILEVAGLSFADVVKTDIFLEDMADFNRVNEIYGQYFDAKNAPARATVEVSSLPKGVNVEISMIAVR
ncbi:MAG: RidA family protein [Flavobacteriales bacterium]